MNCTGTYSWTSSTLSNASTNVLLFVSGSADTPSTTWRRFSIVGTSRRARSGDVSVQIVKCSLASSRHGARADVGCAASGPDVPLHAPTTRTAQHTLENDIGRL